MLCTLYTYGSEMSNTKYQIFKVESYDFPTCIVRFVFAIEAAKVCNQNYQRTLPLYKWELEVSWGRD